VPSVSGSDGDARSPSWYCVDYIYSLKFCPFGSRFLVSVALMRQVHENMLIVQTL
jgi:hypothetical protein